MRKKPIGTQTEIALGKLEKMISEKKLIFDHATVNTNTPNYQ